MFSIITILLFLLGMGYVQINGHVYLYILSTLYMQSATRGTVYGIGQSLGSLGRSVGPLIGEPLFAWSERNGM